MHAALVPSTLNSYSVVGVSSVPPWKLDEFKDLSPGGICEMGYGDQNQARKTLQYVSNIKHREKYTTYLGWGVAVIPAILDILPDIFHDGYGRTHFRDIPGRAYEILNKKLGNVSTEQLGFILSIVPLYKNARAIKSSIWVGSGLDPSGHTMFKVAQYGMMLSIATDHGTKSSLGMPIIYYLAFTVLADAVMLANTFTNCHTLAEVVVGGGLGVAILLTAHFISKYTPLGRWAKGIANIAGKLVGSVGDGMREVKVSLPKPMLA